MLEIKGVSKNFKTFSIKDVNLNLEEGYILGIVGPNGSGKTTLIKMIMGLIKEDSGIIKLFGKNMSDNEIDVKNDIGFVYDSLDFYRHIKVKDFKKIVSLFYKNFDRNKFDYYLEKFDIHNSLRIRNLSKGQSSKLMLANALSHNAKLLILDEPTAGLDPIIRRELIKYLQEYIEDGSKSVIICTHNTEELDKIADYITFINRGKQVFTLDKEEIIESHKIVRGSKEDIMDLDEEIIGVGHFKYFSEALVKVNDEAIFMRNTMNLKVDTANIESMMYYYVGRQE